MTLMTKTDAIERIKKTKPESPLAVFTCDAFGEKQEGRVDVVFAGTVTAQQRINSRAGLVGVYHQRSMGYCAEIGEALQ